MDKKVFREQERKLMGLRLYPAFALSVVICCFVLAMSGISVKAASGLAHFYKMTSANSGKWAVSNASEGGIATFTSVNASEEYMAYAYFSDYTYTAGDLLSIKVDGVDITDDQIMIAFNTDSNSRIMLSNIADQHIGYITLVLPTDANGVFKEKQPTFIRVKGNYKNAAVGDHFSFGGFEIHKAGTKPSWDDGTTPLYYRPEGIAVTYYNGIYSRGFAWNTDQNINESYLYIIKKSGNMNESNINWGNATKIKASMVERTDFEGKKWHLFKAHILDLTPGATYFYKLGNEVNGWSQIGNLKIEQKASEVSDVTFFHMADCQCNARVTYSDWAAALEDAYKRYPNVSYLAFAGDMANDCRSHLNMDHWVWPLDTARDVLMNVVISPTSGNHDIWENCFVDRFDYQYADYLSGTDRELKTGGCYYYTYGKEVLFINMNTNEAYNSNDFKAQIEWLRGILEQHKNYKWKIVQLHKGVISTGDLTSEDQVKGYRELLCPIFSKYQVDLVLQGHYHVYSRSASYSYWTENNEDETKYPYEAYEKAGTITENYSFDGETRLWNLVPAGTHYITINSLQNYSQAVTTGMDEHIHFGINPFTNKISTSQPEKPMYGVVRIKGDILCYDAYTYDKETKESEIYDTFSVDKSQNQVPGPTTAPTTKPTAKPTAAPTAKPTAAPTAKPTTAPTAKPTAAPTAKPTAAPTAKPTAAPTAKPTTAPTAKPTAAPTVAPTTKPTPKPTVAPTSVPASDVTEIFADVPAGKWYVNAVQFVYDRSIMSGKGEDPKGSGKLIFDPDANLTRAEFATILYKMEGKPDVAFSHTILDVKNQSAWYAKPVHWVYEQNIAAGYPNGNFGVADAITREQLAQMLYKYAKLKGYKTTYSDNSLERFGDTGKISNWAVEAMKWATSNGVMNGSAHEVPLLNPKGNATRAECAAMIKSLYEKVIR